MEENKLIRWGPSFNYLGDRATRLIRWGRAIDKQMDAIRAEHEKINSIYRMTLRKERVDLHDDEANKLMNLAFWGWWTGRSTVPVIDIY